MLSDAKIMFLCRLPILLSVAGQSYCVGPLLHIIFDTWPPPDENRNALFIAIEPSRRVKAEACKDRATDNATVHGFYMLHLEWLRYL